MNFKTNLMRVLPAAVVLLGASMAHAQVTSGALALPNGAPGVATVTGGGATLNFTPVGLPVVPGIGGAVAVQFTGANVFLFTDLPATGSGVQNGLTTTVNLTVNPGAVAIGPLNFTTQYNYDSEANVGGGGFDSGTIVQFVPTGSPQFVFGGSTYQVDLNTALVGVQGNPTQLGTNTITGSITLISGGSSAPEPGTLVLAGLGIAGLIARRRRK